MISTSVHLVIVVLVFVELASTALSSQADVNIYHEIQGSDTIQVNCTKGSGYWATHFAPVRLQFGEHYGWGFSPSVWGTTKYYCIFGWEGRTKEVRVWTESEWLPHWKTIPRPCSHCLWHVKRDGVYRQPNDADKAHASVFYVGWV